MHYDFDLHTGSLPQASDAVPIAGRKDAVTISWSKSNGQLHYTLQTPVPLILTLPSSLGGETLAVTSDFRATDRQKCAHSGERQRAERYTMRVFPCPPRALR